MKEMKSNMNAGILPLFYGLSVSELKDEKRRQRWFEKWETFARDDLRGLIEVVIAKMKQVGASQLTTVKVVGLYGMGGIGKTTTCKTLCNELSNDFEGRVCHIEFDSTSSNSKELLQKVLIKLTRRSQEAIQQLDEGECKDVLYKNLMKQKTFLAIDNVWDDASSIKQVQLFFKVPSHLHSLVLVTTWAQRTLELLGVGGGACLEMPKLGQGDARNLFLYHATNGQQFTSEEDMSLLTCVLKGVIFPRVMEEVSNTTHWHWRLWVGSLVVLEQILLNPRGE